jgi:hypothetical protein
MGSAIDPFTPAVELAAAIRRKEVSPLEVADGYLDRMDELDPDSTPSATGPTTTSAKPQPPQLRP